MFNEVTFKLFDIVSSQRTTKKGASMTFFQGKLSYNAVLVMNWFRDNLWLFFKCLSNIWSFLFLLKVYKTSILTFKDRDRYVAGEFRFRRGYCKHNPRKMVRTWAEKEMRNLMRLVMPLPFRANIMQNFVESIDPSLITEEWYELHTIGWLAIIQLHWMMFKVVWMVLSNI